MVKRKEYVCYRRWSEKGVICRVKRESKGGLNWKDYLPTDMMANTLYTIEAANIKEAKQKIAEYEESGYCRRK